jgi:hypothetical protein
MDLGVGADQLHRPIPWGDLRYALVGMGLALSQTQSQVSTGRVSESVQRSLGSLHAQVAVD